MKRYDEARLFSRVLTLYYTEELTQAQIGRKLGLSTAKVNRLLQDARRKGMVEIKIRTPFQNLFDLESQLKTTFGIGDAVVIPRMAEDAATMTHTLGQAAANYLISQLRDGDVIGIGGGTAVHATVQAIEAPRAYDVEVVPVLGATQGQVTTDVNYLAAQLAERLGGRAYQLHAPAFVETPMQRDMLLSMGPIREILDVARRANVALLGVGTVDYEMSRFVEFTALSVGDMRGIAENCGGVGEVAAYVYTYDGSPCAEQYTDRVVGLTLQEVKEIDFIIAVAGTKAKILPIYGALRGGYMHALVTDEAAARGVIDRFERDLQGQI